MPLAVGAAMRVQDSLQEGRSRFLAEVHRVKQVVDLSRGPVPLLFLLDELFSGTNSHDRRLGAEAVVCGLVMLTLIGIPLAMIGLAALGIWIAYRVIRGWLALKDGRPMYV